MSKPLDNKQYYIYKLLHLSWFENVDWKSNFYRDNWKINPSNIPLY